MTFSFFVFSWDTNSNKKLIAEIRLVLLLFKNLFFIESFDFFLSYFIIYDNLHFDSVTWHLGKDSFR